MDKAEALKAIENQLEIYLQAALAEANSAKEAATDTESKAENKYDTRGLEASYIAQAQAKRVLKYQEEIYNLSKVDLSSSKASKIGSVLKCFYCNQNKEATYFLLPSGGVQIKYNGITIQSISISSPLGGLLFKKQADDSFLFRGEEIEILSVI